MMYHPIKCGCKKISTLVDVVETLMLDYMSPHYDPELEDTKPIFFSSCMTLWLLMMHHHTKFGYIGFSS